MTPDELGEVYTRTARDAQAFWNDVHFDINSNDACEALNVWNDKCQIALNAWSDEVERQRIISEKDIDEFYKEGE